MFYSCDWHPLKNCSLNNFPMRSKRGKGRAWTSHWDAKKYLCSSSKLGFCLLPVIFFCMYKVHPLNWVSRLGGRSCPRRPRAEKQKVLGENLRSNPGIKLQRIGGGRRRLQERRQKTVSSRKLGRTHSRGRGRSDLDNFHECGWLSKTWSLWSDAVKWTWLWNWIWIQNFA